MRRVDWHCPFQRSSPPRGDREGQSWQLQVGCRKGRGGVKRGSSGAKLDEEDMKFEMSELSRKLACDE